MKFDKVEHVFACEITYGGIKRITKAKFEYAHTGKLYYKMKGGAAVSYTENKNISDNWREKGFRVLETKGYFYINRIAIPTITAGGGSDWWYINNSNDYYEVNRVSKYGKRIHAELSKEVKTEI